MSSDMGSVPDPKITGAIFMAQTADQ